MANAFNAEAKQFLGDLVESQEEPTKARVDANGFLQQDSPTSPGEAHDSGETTKVPEIDMEENQQKTDSALAELGSVEDKVGASGSVLGQTSPVAGTSFQGKENVREHSVLGIVYRLELDFIGKSDTERVTQSQSASASADLGEAATPEPKARPAKAARAPSAAQVAKQKALTEKRNAKTWSEATKIQAALAPLIAANTKHMDSHLNDNTSHWPEARERWDEIKAILRVARDTVKQYEQNPAIELDKEALAKLSHVRSSAKYFQTLIRDLTAKGAKRKAESES
eukprot:Skav231776  [mRNA]  locus=scaffold3283:84780:85897:+ [translate_table: standard]